MLGYKVHNTIYTILICIAALQNTVAAKRLKISNINGDPIATQNIDQEQDTFVRKEFQTKQNKIGIVPFLQQIPIEALADKAQVKGADYFLTACSAKGIDPNADSYELQLVKSERKHIFLHTYTEFINDRVDGDEMYRACFEFKIPPFRDLNRVVFNKKMRCALALKLVKSNGTKLTVAEFDRLYAINGTNIRLEDDGTDTDLETDYIIRGVGWRIEYDGTSCHSEAHGLPNSLTCPDGLRFNRANLSILMDLVAIELQKFVMVAPLVSTSSLRPILIKSDAFQEFITMQDGFLERQMTQKFLDNLDFKLLKHDLLLALCMRGINNPYAVYPVTIRKNGQVFELSIQKYRNFQVLCYYRLDDMFLFLVVDPDFGELVIHNLGTEQFSKSMSRKALVLISDENERPVSTKLDGASLPDNLLDFCKLLIDGTGSAGSSSEAPRLNCWVEYGNNLYLGGLGCLPILFEPGDDIQKMARKLEENRNKPVVTFTWHEETSI